MEKLIVEIGIKLDNNMFYYDKILKEHGLTNVFTAVTHDIYYTNIDLRDCDEYEIKQACIRLRTGHEREKTPRNYYDVQNNLIKDFEISKVSYDELEVFEETLKQKGFEKIIDTMKIDYHYWKDGMKSRVQLQETEGLGLILYYDNPDYYGHEVLEQRKMLIDELNSYGFNINYEQEGIDKLRTLYSKEEKYSLNQNTTYTWQ